MAAVLHLTLHRKWFEEIVSGRKREEYRDLTPYWERRIEGRHYDEIHFRNGYRKGAPLARVRYLGWKRGEVEGTPVYILALGDILEIRNHGSSP